MTELEVQIREKQARDHAGGRLDYSEGSMAVVEEMLDGLDHFRIKIKVC